MMVSAFLATASPLASERAVIEFPAGKPFEATVAVAAGSGGTGKEPEFTIKATVEARKTPVGWEIELSPQANGGPVPRGDKRNGPERFVHKLPSYSIIAREPDGRIMAIQDRVGSLLRTFWGYKAKIDGQVKPGWVELPPLDLPKAGVLTVSRSKEDSRPLRVERDTIPTRDRDDRTTGFRAVYRSYHWSGTLGKAWVVTFGPECRWQGKDVKLVFPEGGAWVPGYQLSSKNMVQFEFIETWGGGARGCYEPMSDRVDRFGKIQLVEDRPDRKTLRWTYQLANPDYLRWGELAGAKQRPEVEELWTIYPDGSALRRQRYWPVLDTGLEQHVLGNQVAEIDVVWAADTLPEDVTPVQAATVFAPGAVYPISFPSTRQPGDPMMGARPRFGVAVHSKDRNLPDVFMSFGQSGSTNPPYQISTDDEKDWHRERLWRFSHFPFGLEPFEYETNSQTEGRGQISHSSLVYVGAPVDRSWTKAYRTDARGRKYREWISVTGLSRPRDFGAMLDLHRKVLARPRPK